MFRGFTRRRESNRFASVSIWRGRTAATAASCGRRSQRLRPRFGTAAEPTSWSKLRAQATGPQRYARAMPQRKRQFTYDIRVTLDETWTLDEQPAYSKFVHDYP